MKTCAYIYSTYNNICSKPNSGKKLIDRDYRVCHDALSLEVVHHLHVVKTSP